MKKNYEKKEILFFLRGCLIGILFFFAVYGYDALRFTNDALIRYGYVEKDIAQHYAGWMCYRYSPWQFPIGVGSKIAYPVGDPVTYTDSIPLFAILFKIFGGILPKTFQYFGLWVMICFILQGGFGSLLASLFTDRILPCILSAGMFVLSPIVIERAFRHCALTAHFLILAALYYYFRNRKDITHRSFIPFYVINRLAILTHPYFLPFTFGIFFAYCLELFFRKDTRIRATANFLGSMAVSLVIGWAIGAFVSAGTSFQAYGYGVFNMNLNAFINPASRGFANWSKIVGNRPYGPNERRIEGFNYLGLGVLAGLPISLAAYLVNEKKNALKNIFTFIREHYGIILSALALFVFAIGDTVYFGNRTILQIPYPARLIELFGIFRANGRFGWIAVYLIVLFEIYVLTMIRKETISSVILCALVGLQLWDISGVLIQKHDYFHDTDGYYEGQSVKLLLDNPFWEDAAKEYDYVLHRSSGIGNTNIDIAVIFGYEGKAVSSQFSARPDFSVQNRLMDELYENIENETFPEDLLLIVASIPEEYIENIRNMDLAVYYVNRSYAIGSKHSDSEDLERYKNAGNFEELRYPYKPADNPV